MTDAFALLGFERSPHVDLDLLQDRYLTLAAMKHPDAQGIHSGADHFAELREAYDILRDSGRRVRHLLEWEAPELLQQPLRLDPEIVSLNFEIGGLCAGLKDTGTASASALERALQTHALAQKLARAKGLLVRVQSLLAETTVELHALADGWDATKKAAAWLILCRITTLRRLESQLTAALSR